MLYTSAKISGNINVKNFCLIKNFGGERTFRALGSEVLLKSWKKLNSSKC